MFPAQGTTDKSTFYCLHCAEPFRTEYSSKQHAHNYHHVEKPELGLDFAQGWQVEQIRERFLMDSAHRIKVFIYALRQDNYGPEDFLLDCGLRPL